MKFMPMYEIAVSFADKFLTIEAPNRKAAEDKAFERIELTRDVEIDSVEIIDEYENEDI